MNTPTIGDNRPPLVSLSLLEVDHSALVVRVAELEEKAGEQPDRIDDDVTQGRVQDVIKEIDKEVKNAEATRVAVKEPYLEAERTVDGFFKQGLMARLFTVRKKLDTVATAYLRRKADEERARRLEAERKLREEQEKLRKAQREQEERERKLREQNRQKQADAAAEQARAAQAQREAMEAERMYAQQEAQAKNAELARTRSAESGSLGTLRTTWDFNIEDIDEIPPRALWPYISRDAKEKAIRAYIKANSPKDEAVADREWQPLAGVQMFRKSDGVFR